MLKNKLGMMNSGPKKTALFVFFTVLVLFGSSAFATFGLSSDILQEGRVYFSSAVIYGNQTYTRSGHVDYEVYAPGNYNGTLSAIQSEHYVYAYKVYNDAQSQLKIDDFTVNLVPGVAIVHIGYEGADTQPDATSPSTTGSVSYDFYTLPINPDEYSSFLLYSSEYGPIAGNGAVNGEGITSLVEGIPVPYIPEPATCLLFGIGSFLAFSRRRKVS